MKNSEKYFSPKKILLTLVFNSPVKDIDPITLKFNTLLIVCRYNIDP